MISPAPWSAKNTKCLAEVADFHGDPVAEIYSASPDDLRLMLAAPALLEACEEVWEADAGFAIGEDLHDKLRAAIAAARGEKVER